MNKKIKSFLLNLFTPRYSNNYRAKILSPGASALLVGLLLFTQSAINFITLAKPGVLGYSSDITPEKIVALTNAEREKLGLSQLQVSPLLSEAAERKAADMFAFDYWAHISPSGRTPWSFFKEVGYSYTVAGENLAKDFSNPDSVVQAWMKSPTHKDNIVDGRFSDIGVAVVDGTLNGVQTTLVVQLFAAPVNAVSSLEKINSQSGRPAVEAYAQANEEIQALPTPTPSIRTETKEVTTVISPLAITKSISAAIFAVLIFALIIDLYIIRKKKVNRISGKNLAHAGFLAVILLLIILSQQGVIS
jgi:hypothetical protein